MQTLLILEANTPKMVDEARKCGRMLWSDHYVRALKAIAPNVEMHVVEPYRAPLSAVDLDGVDGVIFTGSGVAWSTGTPKAARLRIAAERVFNAGLPTFGSCNGLHLATVLLGGSVGASPKGVEIGLARDVEMTRDGRAHPMMLGRKDRFCAPCVHRDEVQRLPEGAVLIAGNAHSCVQAMVYCANGVDFWGVQYHPELPTTALADYVQETSGISVQRQGLADDLRVAESNADAASRLGATPHDLIETTRTTELVNWLAHLQNRPLPVAIEGAV